MTRNRQIVLRRRPTGLPTVDDYEIRDGEPPRPEEGEILVRTLLLSIDPAMRGWVLQGRNYVQPVPVGAVMRSFGAGQVVESRSPRYQPGDIVAGLTGWQEWAVLTEQDVQRKVDPSLAPISTSLGVLGITGLTAYVGMVEIAQPGAGQTAVVSTAAGAVGSVAGQLAKIHGARTVGLTGSDEKVRLCLEEFGFDACINYRTSTDLAADLAKACPEGIDIYFDSVGGSMLDAVLEHINVGARIPICGTISQPSDAVPTGPRFERRLLVQRATMQGFLVTDHFARSTEIAAVLAGWIRDGRLRYREEIAPRLEDAPAALTTVLSGANMGKMLVHVAEPDGAPDRG